MASMQQDEKPNTSQYIEIRFNKILGHAQYVNELVRDMNRHADDAIKHVDVVTEKVCEVNKYHEEINRAESFTTTHTSEGYFDLLKEYLQVIDEQITRTLQLKQTWQEIRLELLEALECFKESGEAAKVDLANLCEKAKFIGNQNSNNEGHVHEFVQQASIINSDMNKIYFMRTRILSKLNDSMQKTKEVTGLYTLLHEAHQGLNRSLIYPCPKTVRERIRVITVPNFELIYEGLNDIANTNDNVGKMESAINGVFKDVSIHINTINNTLATLSVEGTEPEVTIRIDRIKELDLPIVKLFGPPVHELAA